MGIPLPNRDPGRRVRFGFSLVVCAALAAGVARAEFFQPDTSEVPSDPRLIEANALLSDPDSLGRAAELYRAVLADDPDQRLARLWLARVLSWSQDYDESLAQYAEIAQREGDPDWARKESADVLSWAGRYPEAIDLYRGLLERHPEDFELNVGLAHAYSWSGQTRKAEKAYRRALDLRDDEGLRDELARLREGSPADRGLGQGEGLFLRDSDEFEIWQETNDAHYPLGDRWMFKGQLGFTRIDVDPLPQEDRDHLEALGWRFALEHRLADSLRVEVGMGARHWDHAHDRFVFRSRADYDVVPGSALGLQLTHGDFLDASASFEAVRRGLSYTSIATSWWQQLGEPASAFAIFTASFVSDGNQALSLWSSCAGKPWRGHTLEVAISFGSTSYTGQSDHYYDPDVDLVGDVSLSARFPESGPLFARALAAVGYGYARQDGFAGDGVTYRAEVGAHAEAWGFWIDLSGYRSESQRSSVYTTHGATARIGRSF